MEPLHTHLANILDAGTEALPPAGPIDAADDVGRANLA